MIVVGPICGFQRGDGKLWLEKIVNSMVILLCQLQLWQVDVFTGLLGHSSYDFSNQFQFQIFDHRWQIMGKIITEHWKVHREVTAEVFLYSSLNYILGNLIKYKPADFPY